MHSWMGLLLTAVAAAAPIPVLIVDGQNNHKWQETTPVLKKLLEETGKFTVDVSTSPAKGGDWSSYNPDFSKYKVVVGNYSDFVGDPWPEPLRKKLVEFVAKGGGYVSYHAADNAFPMDLEYNKLIGVGGWGGRTEKDGPMIRFKDGKMVMESKAGKAGNHGQRLPFLVVTRDTHHPITKGLPVEWMHHADELYDSLRGPAENVHLLATAWSDPANKGTGENEPALMTISYGKGRVFHTILGHDVEAMRCVGFIVTFQRGTEWAATGKVSQKVPKDFPTKGKVSLR
ncbi:MAG: ThuA domain-containing protein [Acidobacteriota bacterium]